MAIGRGNTLVPVREIHWPHSIGLLYSCLHLLYRVQSQFWRVQSHGPRALRSPIADRILEEIVDLKEDGSFWLDQSYFNYSTELTMTSRKFHDLFGEPPRDPETPLTQRHMDLAASVQKVTEEIMLRITRNLAATYQVENLCLAGGVALNCIANGKVLRDGFFKRIWIQPAAGDAGGGRRGTCCLLPAL